MSEWGPVGDQIVLAITSKGYSKSDLVAELGVSRSTFYNKLRADSFTESEMRRIAKILKITLDDLRYGEMRAEKIPDAALHLIQRALIEIEHGLAAAQIRISADKKAEILGTIVRHGIRDGRVDPDAVTRLIKLVE